MWHSKKGYTVLPFPLSIFLGNHYLPQRREIGNRREGEREIYFFTNVG
jgi:hypothetical protein